jgi:hypothetical protein
MPALKTKQIKSLKEYIACVESFRGGRSGPIWYRGCSKASHNLKPSLYRHKSPQTIEDFMGLEKKLLSRFQQRSIPFLSRYMANTWEWLFLMQHYTVPTRLLDWSESPLTALFFAAMYGDHKLGLTGSPVFSADAAVWLLDPVQWNRRAINLKSFPGEVLSTEDAHAKAYTPVGDVKTMNPFPIAIYGAHNSQRIVAQRGAFVCFGKDTRPMEAIYEEEDGFPNNCLRKLIIKRGRLPAILTGLVRHGVTDSVVFPDLDGLAKEIRREHAFEVHYV